MNSFCKFLSQKTKNPLREEDYGCTTESACINFNEFVRTRATSIGTPVPSPTRASKVQFLID